jgi:nicotinamide-nucleotide amidase
MLNHTISELSQQLGKILILKDKRCVTVESCTGGALSAAITSVAGSSLWFDRGYITYSNEAKQQMVRVPAQIIIDHGAVSQECAIAMAEGGLLCSNAQIAVAITGIAGPSGGTKAKPVGTVWIAWGSNNRKTVAKLFHFCGNREQIREQAQIKALSNWIDLLSMIENV